MPYNFCQRYAIFLASIFCVVFPSTSIAACAESDKACLNKAQQMHPVGQAAFWQAQLAKPFEHGSVD